jgi:CubicO group peptidase (beta-lactamase class C family)
MIVKFATTLLVILIRGCASYAQSFNKAKLDSFFVALSVHDQNMGSLAIANNGIIVYHNAIGYSQLSANAKVPATIKTKYRIGSVSKMFTGTMIFQLIEEKKLSLTTTLATYFPQLPDADKITIAEMLNHHSGLHNLTDDPLYATYFGRQMSEDELIAIIAKQKPDFEPGTKVSYSNTNFILLGYIIEKITGESYAEELRKRITSKIGLVDTYYGSKTNSLNGEAYSYTYNSQWAQMPETDMSIPGGAGAIVSTPTDLVKFIDALFAGKLISTASLTYMEKLENNYGMAMFVIPFYDKKGYGHTGGIDGFSSLLIYFPVDKLAIAYISNGVVYTTNDVIIAALSIYFNKPFTIPDFKNIILNTADLDKYLGIYSSTQIPLKITISKNNTTLIAQASIQPAFPLDAKGGDKFIFSQAGIVIQFDPTKKIFTLMQGGRNYLFTKTE